MNRIYPKSKEATINFVTDDVRLLMIDLGEYTPNFSTDDFLNDIPAGGRVGTAVALAGKTNSLGVLDANDLTFSAVTGDTVEAYVAYVHTGDEATSKLWLFIDGKFQVEIAADAANAATSITPEDLPAGIASGGTLTKISGTGPATITTSASGSEGARTLSVTALSEALTAGAVYEYLADSAGLPFTPSGGDLLVQWSSGANKILAL